MPKTVSALSSADRFEQFAATYCGLALEPFQRRIVDELHGDVRELLVLIPRGNGKTSLAAALALWHLISTPQPAVYVAAAGRDQARLTFEIARRMAQAHPDLDRRITVRWNELRTRDGFLRILSSDAPRAHGLQPSYAIVDELHAHATPDLYVALKTALGKRGEAQLLTISTAGYDHESVLGQLRERALAAPHIDQEGTLTVARDPAARFTMFQWACPDDADLTNPAVLKTANPATFVTTAFLAEQIASPGLHPLELARYHANVWTATDTSWLPVGAWQACAADYTIQSGEPVWAGVDIGGERAASALVYLTEDLRISARIWQGDEAVLDVLQAVRDLARHHDLRTLLYDPWRFQAPALELEREGLPVVQFPQSNVRMVPASERLYAAVVEGRLKHPNDPDLNRHIAAIVARQTERGTRIDKAKARHQVDAAVALAMALEAAENRPQPAQLLGWL